jgi:hypothetical protein
MSSFVTKSSPSSIVHQYLIPATLTTTINNHPVTIISSTNYPFSSTLSYEILTSTPFDFYIRIPEWSTNASTYTVNIQRPNPVVPDEDGLLHIPVPIPGAIISVNLESEIRIVPRDLNTVSIYKGYVNYSSSLPHTPSNTTYLRPLLYALSINYTTISRPALSFLDLSPLPSNTTDPRSLDHTITPTNSSLWSVAIDTSQIQFIQTPTASLPNPIYAPGGPPVEIWVVASNITWPETLGTAALPPDPVEVIGEPFWAKLVPYGSSKLHMGELPVVSLPKLGIPNFVPRA